MTSLRYKFLFLLIGMVLMTIGTFLAIAFYVFKSDKTSYVFDSTMSQSKSLARSFRSEMEFYVETTKTLAQATDLRKQTLTPLGSFIFNEKADMLHFEVWIFDSQLGERTLVSSDNSEYSYEIGWTEFKNELKNKSSSTHFKIENANEGIILLAIRGQDPVRGRQLWSISAYRSRELLSNFSVSGTSNSFLYTRDGNEVLGATHRLDGQKLPQLKQWLSRLFLPQSTSSLDFGGERFLTSAVDVGIGGVYVITLIKEETAMAVIQQLFLHSLYFSGALFFLVVLISIFSSSGITSNLKKLTQATSEVAQGNFGIKIHVKSSDEVGVLSKSFNLMTEKISLLMSETEEKVRMESELKTAQAVQNTLFPEASASWEDFTLHGFYQSASECGGDWWYHHRIEDRVYIWVGDATGHGAAAALITSAARAAASLVEWQPNIGPGQALRILNRAIYSTSKGGMMMTFFVGCFDISEGKLYYSNASHNPPFLLKNPRSKDSLSKADFEPLIEANNPRLGQGEDFFFEEASIDVGPGDCVVFYSDGITELKNTEHRDYGERKFLKSLSKNFVEGQNVKEIVEKVVKDAYDYRNDHPLEDDVTLVIAEFKPDEGSKEEAA